MSRKLGTDSINPGGSRVLIVLYKVSENLIILD